MIDYAAKIKDIAARRQTRINVEFEGVDHGHDLPEDKEMAATVAQWDAEVATRGNVLHAGVEYSRAQFDDMRARWNAAAMRMGKAYPAEIEKATGLSRSLILSLKKSFGV